MPWHAARKVCSYMYLVYVCRYSPVDPGWVPRKCDGHIDSVYWYRCTFGADERRENKRLILSGPLARKNKHKFANEGQFLGEKKQNKFWPKYVLDMATSAKSKLPYYCHSLAFFSLLYVPLRTALSTHAEIAKKVPGTNYRMTKSNEPKIFGPTPTLRTYVVGK